MKIKSLKKIHFLLLIVLGLMISACGDKTHHADHDHAGHDHSHHHDDMDDLEQAVINELNATKEDGYIQDNIESERKTKAESAIKVDNAWVRALIPGQNMTAAYFDIKNVSQQEHVIVGIATDIAKKAEIHESVNVDGKVSMKELARLSLSPGQTWSFEPGGLHIMLMGMSDGVPLPATTEFVFTLSSGEQIKREFSIRSAQAASDVSQSAEHTRH